MLTHTLKTLHPISAAALSAAPDDPDMLEDIDEFRRDLAQRISLIMESWVSEERLVLERQFDELSDDELKELAAVGRERGMRAFLAAP